MKTAVILVFLSLSMLWSVAHAAVPCNYAASGDGQCSPKTGLYCVNYSCQTVSDASVYCKDSDANNLVAAGTLSARYRDYAGAWVALTAGDNCLLGGTFVLSCSGSNCSVREATCTTGGKYAFAAHPCSSCQKGACLGKEYSLSSAAKESVQPTLATSNPTIVMGIQPDTKTGLSTSTTTAAQTGTIPPTNASITGDKTSVEGLTSVSPVIVPSTDSKIVSPQTTPTADSVTSPAPVSASTPQTGAAKDLTTLGRDGFINVPEQPLDIAAVNSPSVGRACDYLKYQDAQCDAANSVFCVEGACRAFPLQSLKQFCTDPDDKNVFVKGELGFLYRTQDTGGVVSGNLADVCVDANRAKEYYCNGIAAGQNYSSDIFKCQQGCSDGLCNQPDATQLQTQPLPGAASKTQKPVALPDASAIKAASKAKTTIGPPLDANATKIRGAGQPLDINALGRSKNIRGLHDTNATPKTRGPRDINTSSKSRNAPRVMPDVNASAMHCSNLKMDSDEEGVDCGGSRCLSCQTPESVSNENLLSLLSRWSRGEISDQRLMELIEIWRNR